MYRSIAIYQYIIAEKTCQGPPSEPSRAGIRIMGHHGEEFRHERSGRLAAATPAGGPRWA